MNNEKDEISLGKIINYTLVNEECESARFLSFMFRALTFLFLLPALIFLFKAHSWLGFGVFLGFAVIFGLVAYYFRAKTITFSTYLRKKFERK